MTALSAADFRQAHPSAVEQEVIGLFDQWREPLLRYLSSGSSVAYSDSEDIIQETFLACSSTCGAANPVVIFAAGCSGLPTTWRERSIHGPGRTLRIFHSRRSPWRTLLSIRLRIPRISSLPTKRRGVLWPFCKHCRSRIAGVCICGRKACVIVKSPRFWICPSAQYRFAWSDLWRALPAPPNGEFVTSEQSHLSDQELLLVVDGELSERDAGPAVAHLATCWACMARKQEIEAAIGDFIRLHSGNLGRNIPPPEGPRALLKAQLAQLGETERPRWFRDSSLRPTLAIVLASFGLGLIAYLISAPWAVRQATRLVAVTVPNPSLTPGATVLVSREEVCRESNTKNKAVPVALQRAVFDEYGIHTTEPRAYEVDYLITPALGGADDIHNLWPQSYKATVWNAEVKDALEDHLRDLFATDSLIWRPPSEKSLRTGLKPTRSIFILIGR